MLKRKVTLKTMKIPVKQVLILLITIALCISLSACKKPGAINDAEIDYGNSVKFDETEIKSAADVALEHFRDNFHNCELKKIWYDEEMSNNMVESYLTYGPGAFGHGIKKVEPENVIAFLFDFYVEPYGAEPCFSPDTMNNGWNLILVRDSRTGIWRFADGGG